MLSDQASSVKLATRMGLVHPLVNDIEGLQTVTAPELTSEQLQVKRAGSRYPAPIILILGDPQAAMTMALAHELPNSSFIVADPWETDEEYNRAIATIYPQRMRILPLASDMQRMLSWRLPPLGPIIISNPERIQDLPKVVNDAWGMLGRGGVLAAVRGGGSVAAMRQLGVPVSSQRGKSVISEPRRDGSPVTNEDGVSVNFTRIHKTRTENAAARNSRGRNKSGKPVKGAKASKNGRTRAGLVQPRNGKDLPIQIGSHSVQEQNSSRLLKLPREWVERKPPESELRL